MGKQALLLLLLLWVGAASASKVVRCVDPATGKVTFTDGACPQGRSGEQVQVHQGNVIDSAPVRERMERLEAQRQEQAAQRQEQQRQSEALRQQAGDARAQEEWERLCRGAGRAHRGTQSGQLTAAQRSLLAECAGISLPQGSPGYTIPAPPPPPSVITSCDAGGCWDNQGGRYNKGAGPTYFRNDGRACQHIGGQMHCP